MDPLFWATRPLPYALQMRAFGMRERARLAKAPRPQSLDAHLLGNTLPDLAGVEAPPSDELPEIRGAVNPGERRAIYALIRSLNAKSVLEIGTHVGGSTRMIVRALTRNGGGSLTSVDIYDVNAPGAAWSQLGIKLSPREAVDAMKADEVNVKFLTRRSIDFLKATPERYDLIFLDGGHEAPTVLAEVPLALKILNPNGLILLHDYFPELKPIWKSGHIEYGPYLAMQVLKELPGGKDLRVQSLGELPWPTKEGSNRTCLAVVLSRASH